MSNESISTMAQFTEILRNNPDGAYDFIANNYWKMSKEEIVSITKELMYAIHSNVTKVEHDAIMLDVAIELDEQYEDEYNAE